MRRLFIIRKDLHLSSGKLAAMVGHCCEAYWTNLLKAEMKSAQDEGLSETHDEGYKFPVSIDRDVWDEYVNGIFTKTICEAKNLNQLRKVEQYIAEVNAELAKPYDRGDGKLLVDDRKCLVQKVDYGWINDKCLTELTPENPDGTTTIGVWFKPLPDDIAHKISKKFKLYHD